MNFYINNKFSDCITFFENELNGQSQRPDNNTLDNNKKSILYYNIASSCFNLGQTKKCKKMLEKSLELNKNCYQSHILLGKLFFDKDPSKSESYYKKALDIAIDLKDVFLYDHIKNIIDSTNNIDNITMITYNINKENEKIQNNKIKNTAYIKLKEIHDDLLNNKQKNTQDILKNMQSKLPVCTGDKVIDDLTSLAYIHLNTKNMILAKKVFSLLLDYSKDLVSVHIGLGSLYALTGKYNDAIQCFSDAIILNPSIKDAWKRRGQTRVANGIIEDGLNDFKKIIELGGDDDIYYQIGYTYYIMKNYKKARFELDKSLIYEKKTVELYSKLAVVENQLGNIDESIKYYKTALNMSKKYDEVALNFGQFYKDIGDYDNALLYFNKIIDYFHNEKEKPSVYYLAYSYRSCLYHGVGNITFALNDILKAIENNKKDTKLLSHYAMLLFSLGKYSLADNVFKSILEIDNDSYIWFQRQILITIWKNIDVSLNTINLDKLIDSTVKEGFCKRYSWKSFVSPNYKELDVPKLSNIQQNNNLDKEKKKYLNLADKLGSWIQLNCKGFLKNVRQQRQFGLAVIEMANNLFMHCKKGELFVDNSASSTITNYISTNHSFSWRDYFDIAIRWRQISEPNDAVWWIDLLTQDGFNQGFGLQTPIINGQLKTFRYYYYYDKAFSMMKKLIISDGYYINEEKHEVTDNLKKNAIKNAKDLDELSKIMSNTGFYVITKCDSLVKDGEYIEGTRLTLLGVQSDGYEFSIRTAGIPCRWKLFEKEMDYCFEKLVHCINSENNDAIYYDNIVKSALSMFYYWVNFAPLTRGTAATGYAGLLASIVSTGKRYRTNLPENIQLDWEAILAPNLESFIETAFSWLVVDNIEEECIKDSYRCNTIREMVELLNYERE